MDLIDVLDCLPQQCASGLHSIIRRSLGRTMRPLPGGGDICQAVWKGIRLNQDTEPFRRYYGVHEYVKWG